MMAPLGAIIWLYSDDALPRFPCASDKAEDRLHAVRAVFDEFGEYTGLSLNLFKTKILMQGVGPWPSQLAGMSVVPWVKYLGALFGGVAATEAYEKGLTVFESRCVLISCMPLSRQEKVQLVHTWCYPVLQVLAVAYYPPPPRWW